MKTINTNKYNDDKLIDMNVTGNVKIWIMSTLSFWLMCNPSFINI